jgi:ferredoxin/flavodoxin---NADP+ reductase
VSAAVNTILKKETLAPQVVRFRIDAPRIARKRKAGQFIILRTEEGNERIPLTIANGNAAEGWIEIIFQVVGHGTTHLGSLNVGDSILDVAGPLGKPTHVEKFGRCLAIGGGVGIAPLYPIVAALKDAGNHVTTILGARSANIMILESDMAAKSDNLVICTDDGTKGRKGFVSDAFKELLAKGETFDFAIVIGPAMMMKVTTALTVAAGIKTFASLNPIMVDGTGMCGGCRVTVHKNTKFACVDGPEFDASGIDWDELLKRLNSYKGFEKKTMDDHTCKLVEAQ